MAEFLCDLFKSDIGTELVKRERIVRCRDCVHWDGDAGCTLLDFAMDKDISDGFCAWGEPREVE